MNESVNKAELIDWLFAQEVRGIHPGLERMQALLAKLDHPERGLRAVQIGGTNGKGTTTRVLSEMLVCASELEPERWGVIGEYTSPHLHEVNERVRINRSMINDAAFVHHLQTLRQANANIHATFFELLTALALLEFKAQNVTWAVLEIGLGGRLDATSAVKAEACAITSVALDHTEFLGNTVEAIAQEKASILDPHQIAVTGASGTALEIIKLRAKSVGAELWALSEEIILQDHSNAHTNFLEIKTPLGTVHGQTQMLGAHTARNCALATSLALRLGLPKQAIELGLSRAYWPGRLEFIARDGFWPDLLVDAAHNPQGAEALATFIHQRHPQRTITLIVGNMRDKDCSGIAKILHPLAQHTITTAAQGTDRAAAPEKLALHYPGAHIATTPQEALILAREITPSDGMILVAGTIPLTAQALEIRTFSTI